MSANSATMIIVCAVAGAVVVLASFCRDQLVSFNRKHHLITYSDSLVEPASWNDGQEGVDESGVPYFRYDIQTETPLMRLDFVKQATEKTEECDAGGRAA